jgi:hypothetical protein
MDSVLCQAGCIVIAWIWLVTGQREQRGVAGTIGKAQEAAEEVLKCGGDNAVIEAAIVTRNPATGRQNFRPTGRGAQCRITNGRPQWTHITRRSIQ